MFTQGHLVAIGGHDGISRHRSCEWYNPQENQWSLLPEMNLPRSDLACVVHENRIFAIGGFNGTVRQHMCSIKDTILRSTINDYFENGPDGRLTAWVYPRYLCDKMLPSSNFEIGKLNTPTSALNNRPHERLSLYNVPY